MWHRYEKLDENYKLQYCPAHDPNGEITGQHVMQLRDWFDENPEERKRLGWIKHLYYESHEEFMKDYPDYDPATQVAVKSVKTIDEWTVQDEYHFINKTDKMMELEEILETMNLYVPSGLVQLDAQGGVLV